MGIPTCIEQRKDWANADAVHMGRIEDEHFLEHAFRDSKPDVVIHLATYPNAHMVKNNPVDATGNMITANININLLYPLRNHFGEPHSCFIANISVCRVATRI